MSTIEVYKKNTWLKEDSMDIMIKVMTFMLSPFLSFIYSLRRINTKSSYVVFFLFAFFYGLCFTVIADNLDVWETNDAAKWRFRFENTNLETFDDYIRYCTEYFLFIGTDIRDLYIGTLFFFVHKFSDNYHIFFCVIALVFSYFQLKSLRFLVNSPSFDNGIVCLVICALFLNNTISNISAIRFPTAAWMCVYGILQFFYNKKSKYLALLLMLPLIHRGFLFFYPILLLVLFFRDKGIWRSLYFVSFLFSGLSIYIIRDATNYLPGFLSNMIEAYTEETTFERNSLTKLFFSNLAVIYVNILFILIMKAAKTYLPEKMKSIYHFTFVFISIVNFVMPIPSLGGRFLIIAETLIAFLWFNIMGTRSKYNFLIYLLPLFMARRVYMITSSFMKFQDLDFFYMNPFFLIDSHI